MTCNRRKAREKSRDATSFDVLVLVNTAPLLGLVIELDPQGF